MTPVSRCHKLDQVHQKSKNRLVSSIHLGRRRVQTSRRVRTSAAQEVSGWSGEDFYSILGLHPAADAKAIKVAYYNLMRQYHPDQAAASSSSSSGDGFDTNEFCVLLNEIYKTLSDPEARAMYDAIAGFSANAINPFHDTSYPADQVFVDEVSCIGCGKCVRACPAAFFIEGSKYGRARVVPGANMVELQDEVEVAILTCPVDCIHWVTSPQLSLLETALAGMGRVDAFIMLRNHRSPGNVFEEANRAWNKRQANIAALRQQHDYAAAGGGSSSNSVSSGWMSFWSQYVEIKSPESAATDGYSGYGPYADDEAASQNPAQSRRVADLAAAASRAMRRWKVYHKVNSKQKVLTG